MLALITATRNSMETLPQALASLKGVRDRVKSIFVDGRSSDGTLEYLQAYVDTVPNATLLSQDGSGLYPALNQGVEAALDDPAVSYIGMLHSDDRLITPVFDKYLWFIQRQPAPVFYSGIEYHDASGKRARVWRSGEFSNFKLNTGWMPPHTSIVVTKDVYRDIGLYNPDFGTAADYEWVVRVFSAHGNASRYFPERTLSMLVGGASNVSLKARLRANAMDGRVWDRGPWPQSTLIRFAKPMRKVGQFVVFKRS